MWKIFERENQYQDLGIDTYGSTSKEYHEEGRLMKVLLFLHYRRHRGDIIPQCVDFSVIDHFEKVTDKDGALMAQKSLKRKVFLLCIQLVQQWQG